MSKITFQELWDHKYRIKAKLDLSSRKLEHYLLSNKDLTINELIHKFTYNEMRLSNPDFCPLYANDKLCHKMTPETLNCLTCLCPNYLLEISFDNDRQLYKIGKCSAGSAAGFYKETRTKNDIPGDILILNCVNCLVPHQDNFIHHYIEKKLRQLP